MIDLKSNFKRLEQRISEACKNCGRDPSEVSILPVSKTKPSELLVEAHTYGYKRFGENKVQEIEEKANELSRLNLKFCLIGHLQSNKVNKAAKYASEIHSLDRLKTAVSLEKALQKEGRSIEALIQVNTSNEPQKSGLPIGSVVGFVKSLESFSSLKVKGLMTLALQSKEEFLVRPCFMKLKTLQEQLRQEASGKFNFDVLSMGMSQDLEWAIAEGSTEIRVGTDLFGTRDSK